MDDLKSNNSIWMIEIQKFCTPPNRRIFLIVLVVLVATPWLTLRNFDVKFEEYSWWYLDDSLLHFAVYSTAYRLSWILLILIPWFFYAAFSVEYPHFLRKNNSIFYQILGLKFVGYVATIFLWMTLIWGSTFIFYQFMCFREMVAPETGAWGTVYRAMANLGVRAALVYPLMAVIFLSFNRNWS